MILEISYTLQHDKNSQEKGYTYYHSKSDDFAIAVKEASKHYKVFLRENGWTRKAKLNQIIKLRNANETLT